MDYCISLFLKNKLQYHSNDDDHRVAANKYLFHADYCKVFILKTKFINYNICSLLIQTKITNSIIFNKDLIKELFIINEIFRIENRTLSCSQSIHQTAFRNVKS